MQYIVDGREMKKYDANTVGSYQVPSLVLMERAALETAAVIKEEKIDAGRTLVVCGCGNNGGDGLALARLLFLEKNEVTVVLVGDERKATEETARQLAILRAYKIEVKRELPGQDDATLVVDALFGIGLSRNLEGQYADVVREMNRRRGTKLAIDIPSGVDASSGALLGETFRADITVTFAYGKRGHYLWPGASVCGKVFVRRMGIEEESWLGEVPSLAAYTKKELAKLPPRRSHTNKGSYGKLLLIAGSVNMAGASVLAARAAYAAGCGLVRVYTPEENRVILQTAVPEAILTTYAAKGAGWEKLAEALQWADVVVLGPGVGRGKEMADTVKYVTENAAVPMILDADALNLMAENRGLFDKIHTDVVVTPHLGEMGRLCDKTILEIQSNIIGTAEEFAAKYHVVCALKDARTIVSLPDGQSFLNLSGNNGMATAGSGDVLAGIIGALAAQGLSVGEAAPLGVFLHGMAGDEICKETGTYGMMAEDLVAGIKIVLRKAERHEYE